MKLPENWDEMKEDIVENLLLEKENYIVQYLESVVSKDVSLASKTKFMIRYFDKAIKDVSNMSSDA